MCCFFSWFCKLILFVKRKISLLKFLELYQNFNHVVERKLSHFWFIVFFIWIFCSFLSISLMRRRKMKFEIIKKNWYSLCNTFTIAWIFSPLFIQRKVTPPQFQHWREKEELRAPSKNGSDVHLDGEIFTKSEDSGEDEEYFGVDEDDKERYSTQQITTPGSLLFGDRLVPKEQVLPLISSTFCSSLFVMPRILIFKFQCLFKTSMGLFCDDNRRSCDTLSLWTKV